MSKFERNDISLINKEIRNNVQHPVVGVVDEVFEHTVPTDDYNFEANVLINGQTEMEEECPILNPGSEAIDVPESGDKVLLIYTDEDTKKPHIVDTVWTNKDRPPIGKAGMMRRKMAIADSADPSPSGDGDIFFTGYTEYDKEAASTVRDVRTPEKSVMQIAKHASDTNLEPTAQSEIPAKIEFYDAPVDDESHIHIDSNVIDGDENLGMDVYLDLKKGELHVRGENDNDGDEYEFVIDIKNQTAKIVGDSDSGNTMGASFDFDTDEFKIADGNKFGIKSDGSGNFVWDHKSIDFNEVSGGTGGINL